VHRPLCEQSEDGGPDIAALAAPAAVAAAPAAASAGSAAAPAIASAATLAVLSADVRLGPPCGPVAPVGRSAAMTLVMVIIFVPHGTPFVADSR
jgi:uncharacterized membrane protein YeiB